MTTTERRTREYALATRAHALPASALRELLLLRRTEQTLDFAGGHPDPALFPFALLEEASTRLFRRKEAASLAYGPSEGIESLRASLAARLERRGYQLRPENILITSGSQNALAALAWCLGEPGESVLVEAPGYPGAFQAFRAADARIAPLRLSEDGWDLDAFRSKRPRLAYVGVLHQNPTGRCVSERQRSALLNAAASSGSWLIEDDAYGELSFDGRSLRPLAAEAPDVTILIGSLSKVLSPGLRLGYIAAPRQLIAPLTRYLQATHLQPSSLAQHLAFEVLSSGRFDEHLQFVRARYAERMAEMASILEDAKFEHRRPGGGLFLWTRPPETETSFEERALAHNIITVPERVFAPNEAPESGHLRFSFGRPFDASALRLRLSFLGKRV